MPTVQEFAQSCATLSSNEIYEKLESAGVELRDAVFEEAASLGVVYANEPEPTRAAMYALGVRYDIQALREY